MEGYKRSGQEGKAVFVGVDLYRFKWHVTVRKEDQELFSGPVPGQWESLRRLLDRYLEDSIHVVYEAGYFGFWLHDRVVAYGAQCSWYWANCAYGVLGGVSRCISFPGGRTNRGICGFDAITVFQCGEDPNGSDYGHRQKWASGDTDGGLVEIDHQGWSHAREVYPDQSSFRRKAGVVASARTLLLKLRRILLDGCPYAMGVIG